MKYVLITDTDVIIKSNLQQVKNETKAELTEDQFQQLGNCKVAKIAKRDLEILVDAKQFLNIPAHKLFKRESGSVYLLPLYLMIIVLMVQGCVK